MVATKLLQKITTLMTASILASCATTPSASRTPTMSGLPSAQRFYDQISAIDLYSLLEEVFLQEGFKIGGRNYRRGYISTTWYQYDGDRHGFVTWREQRMTCLGIVDTPRGSIFCRYRRCVYERPRNFTSEKAV